MEYPVRISQGQRLDQPKGLSNTEQASGYWKGMPVRQRLERDVDDEIRKIDYRRSTGLDAPYDKKSLNERTASLDTRSQALSPEAMVKLSRVFGGDANNTRLAQKYLNYFQGQHEKPKLERSLNSLLQHYIALQKLAAALRESDDDFVARMTPQSDGKSSLPELAEKLIEAGDDPAALQEVLSEVEGLPEDSDELHALLKTLRFKPDQLKQTLRGAQKLPELNRQEKQALLEQVEDVLLQLEIDDGTRIKAARNGIEKGFESGDPESFVESYSDVIQQTGSFLNTLTTLARRHTPDELRHVIPLMKQTLADELQLDQHERSTDKIKLECVLSELSYMHISSTFLEKIRKLVDGMNRIYGNATAA